MDGKQQHASVLPHKPQTMKFNPAPCQSPLKNIVISKLTRTRGGWQREPPSGMKT